MTSILVSAETETWVIDPGKGSDEAYSWQGETGGAITNVWASIDETSTRRHYGSAALIPFAADVKAGDTVYVVAVCYTTGGTFQRDGGQAQIVDAFLAANEANNLAAAVTAHGETSYELMYDGKQYRCPWSGYFESLDKVEVWAVRVRRSPKDPYSEDSSPAMRYGR